MKLSFSTLGCPDWTLEKIAEKGKETGFDGVELRIEGHQHVDPSLSSKDRLNIRNLFEKNDLEICCLSGYTRFSGLDKMDSKKNEDELCKNIRLAYDLGTPCVRSFLGGDGNLDDDAADTVRSCCDFASKMDVGILLEIHDSLKTGKQAKNLLDRLNCDALHILWDIHHSLAAEELPEDTFAFLKDDIRHVHIKDADANDNLCLVGDGILPVGDVLHVLKNNRYNGFLSFEWEKMWIPELQEPEIAFPAYISFMKNFR